MHHTITLFSYSVKRIFKFLTDTLHTLQIYITIKEIQSKVSKNWEK